MKLTQKLLGFFNRVFSKDPDAFLALRLQYDGGMAWAVNNGILTTVVKGGSGSSLTVDLSQYTVRQLVSYLAAQPGYSIPYAETGPLASLSARVLIDGGADIATSNGDYISGYTSLLWSYVDAGGKELQDVATQIDQMLLQMDTHTASAEWLDELGSYYGIPRDSKGTLLVPGSTNLATASGTLTTGWFNSVSVTPVPGTTYQGIETYQGLAKTLSTSSESKALALGAVGAGNPLTLTIALRAGSVAQVSLGLYDTTSGGPGWGVNGNSTCVFLEGPGSISGQSGCLFSIVGLSATVDTLVQITRTYTVSTSSASLLIYPGLNSSVTVGHSILATRVQVEPRATSTPYIPTTTTAVTRAAQYGVETDAVYAPRIIAEVLRPRNNNVAMELAVQQFTGQSAQVVDVVEYGTGTGQFTYNSAYTYNSAKQYNSNSNPIYGKFDVVYSYDLLGGTDPTAFRQTVSDLINRLRAAGTHLRAMSLQTSAIYDSVTAPTDGGNLKFGVGVSLADTVAVPADSMGVMNGGLGAFADAVAASTDTINLSVNYGATYGGKRTFNSAIKYANTGAPVGETL